LDVVLQLLKFLVTDASAVNASLFEVGFTEAEIDDAWAKARRSGYTKSMGLGQDRITREGRLRASSAHD
jgi:hypothetical protein